MSIQSSQLPYFQCFATQDSTCVDPHTETKLHPYLNFSLNLFFFLFAQFILCPNSIHRCLLLRSRPCCIFDCILKTSTLWLSRSVPVKFSSCHVRFLSRSVPVTYWPSLQPCHAVLPLIPKARLCFRQVFDVREVLSAHLRGGAKWVQKQIK